MQIASYILSFVATVLGLIEPFNKKMKTVLIFNLLGNILVGVSYFLDAGYSGGFICAVAVVELIINYTFTSRDKKIPVWIIVLNACLFIAVNLITFKYWYDLLALLASLLFVLSIVQASAKFYRVLYILNSLVWIAYDVLAKVYGNLFTHGVLFIAILIAIIVRDVKKEKDNTEKGECT